MIRIGNQIIAKAGKEVHGLNRRIPMYGVVDDITPSGNYIVRIQGITGRYWFNREDLTEIDNDNAGRTNCCDEDCKNNDIFGMPRKKESNMNKLPEIKKVYFNDPVTVVMWSDHTKTIVRAGKNDIYDPEKGLAMAIAKKTLGNKGSYYDEFKKWLPKQEAKPGYDTFNLFDFPCCDCRYCDVDSRFEPCAECLDSHLFRPNFTPYNF